MSFRRGNVLLYLPMPEAVKSRFDEQSGPAPFWAKLWPAALALSQYIDQHPNLVKGKNVLEIAGGLGLPSLVAAQWARQVCCTDYAPEAIDWMEASARANGCSNLSAAVLDWNHLPQNLDADVLLLSDINYDPSVFETLFQVLEHFLQKGSLILLSTPQRLMAKPFIERILPLCKQTHTDWIQLDGATTATSVFVLYKSHLGGYN